MKHPWAAVFEITRDIYAQIFVTFTFAAFSDPLTDLNYDYQMDAPLFS
jgi:hypothetical protein